MNNINGELTDTGNIFKGNILLGTYTTINKIDDNYHSGWLNVNFGANFNSTNFEEKNANLVVRNITLENYIVKSRLYKYFRCKTNQDIATEPNKSKLLSH